MRRLKIKQATAIPSDLETELQSESPEAETKLPEYVFIGDARTRSAEQQKELEEFLVAEKRAVLAGRIRDQRYETGIALSGGGIRSAIFCLGALQAFAAKDLLGKFDYMSTVSGGGYIAGALQWLWHTRPNTGTSANNFPYGCEEKLVSSVADNQNLAYLRAHGKYLTPGDGLTIWTLMSVVIRTLFLNLVVWLPIGGLVFLTAILLFMGLPERLPIKVWNPLENLVPGVWTKGLDPTIWQYHFFFALCIWVVLLALGVFLLWALAFSLDTRISPRQASGQKTMSWVLVSSFALLGMAGLVWYFVFNKNQPDPTSYGILFFSIFAFVVCSAMVLLQLRAGSTSANYLWRRKFETTAGISLPWISIIAVLGTVPILPYFLVDRPAWKTILSGVGAFSGLATGAFGHWAQAQKGATSNTMRWALMVGSALFLYFIAVLSYCIAQLLFTPKAVFGNDQQDLEQVVGGVIIASFVTAIILAWRTNVNYVGLHRFYRDRLMEAFMPDQSCLANNTVGRSPVADRLSLAELWPSDATKPARQIPYPIINTNAIMINDEDRQLATRGGANFILSPLYIGSDVTGWERTDRHIAKHGVQTLASAIAASGAALNANSAYVGEGLTRDRLLSILMTLLNLRLGLWVGRPSKRAPTKLGTFEPNHFIPSFWYGMTREGYKRNRAFVELSDGGHFDNLGIYELIRRRLQLIVVIDGEEDNRYAMAALYSVAQRVKEDFDASIDLDNCLNNLVPAPAAGYPKDAEYVPACYFSTTIGYPKNQIGQLIYIKLSLLRAAGFAAKGYQAQHPDFPHESTSNQFFVPEQIEAYRAIGFANAMSAIAGLSLDATKF
jgi:hypothetical protein